MREHLKDVTFFTIAVLILVGGIFAAYKVGTTKAHSCLCGCVTTGRCTCPNCNVGCGVDQP